MTAPATSPAPRAAAPIAFALTPAAAPATPTAAPPTAPTAPTARHPQSITVLASNRAAEATVLGVICALPQHMRPACLRIASERRRLSKLVNRLVLAAVLNAAHGAGVGEILLASPIRTEIVVASHKGPGVVDDLANACNDPTRR